MTEQEKKELFEIISNARSNRFSNDEIARTNMLYDCVFREIQDKYDDEVVARERR